jgi:hypothetical protein
MAHDDEEVKRERVADRHQTKWAGGSSLKRFDRGGGGPQNTFSNPTFREFLGFWSEHMTNRHGGRLSKAERELVLIGDDDGGIVERPKPLPELTPEEKDEWTAICAAVPATYFPPATWPIVRSYCRHVVLERHLARMIRREASKKAFDLKRYQALTRELRAQTSAIVACLRSLRLTHLASYGGDRTALPEATPKPWLS